MLIYKEEYSLLVCIQQYKEMCHFYGGYHGCVISESNGMLFEGLCVKSNLFSSCITQYIMPGTSHWDSICDHRSGLNNGT